MWVPWRRAERTRGQRERQAIKALVAILWREILNTPEVIWRRVECAIHPGKKRRLAARKPEDKRSEEEREGRQIKTEGITI